MQFYPVDRLYRAQPDINIPSFLIVPKFLRDRLESFGKPLTDALDFDVVSSILSRRELKFYHKVTEIKSKILSDILDPLAFYENASIDKYDRDYDPMVSMPRYVHLTYFTDLRAKDNNVKWTMSQNLHMESAADGDSARGAAYANELEFLSVIAGAPSIDPELNNESLYSFTVEHLSENDWIVNIVRNEKPLTNKEWYNVYRDAAEQLFKRYGFRSIVRTGLMAEVIARSQL